MTTFSAILRSICIVSMPWCINYHIVNLILLEVTEEAFPIRSDLHFKIIGEDEGCVIARFKNIKQPP